MKLLWFGILLLLSGSPVETDYWKVSADSKIIIYGTSNINAFKCTLDEYHLGEEFISDEYSKGYLFSQGTISLMIEDFDCGHNMMNRDFYETLQSKKYPVITLNLERIFLETDIVGEGIFEVIIGGQKKEDVVIDLEIHKSINQMEITGTKKFHMSEFGIEPPTKFFGMIKVNDIIEINFDLRMVKS